jgi:alginate O-acetyltransferase complex protein AlgI
MVFCSPIFLFLFLPTVLSLYWILPSIRARNYWLLLTSLLFYAWGETVFLLLLLGSTLCNYFLGLWVERLEDEKRRKSAIVLAVSLNIGLLAFFKYSNFAVDMLSPVSVALGFTPLHSQIPLPIGISFFTFHALSYVLDIYRGKSRAATNPADTALYIFFFPQLIAGPMLRWSAISPQLIQRSCGTEMFASGVQRFVWGLAKKMIIANALASPADQIFALPPAELNLSIAWFGLVCYTLQIYFDFSGYSDMAVGLGKMFGFDFIENFNFPYVSQSVRDFWRRWHISLSSWFRDYLYIPLGGNRVSKERSYFNLVLVFFLCGLWHGANWTFILWGLYHGVFLVLERTRFGTLIDRFPRPLRHLYTVLVVMLGWVLFRTNNLREAASFFAALSGLGSNAPSVSIMRYVTNQALWGIGLGVLFSVPLWPWIRTALTKFTNSCHGGTRLTLEAAGLLVDSLLVVALLLVSAAWLAGGTYNPFIYFKF